MQQLTVDGELFARLVQALSTSPLFASLAPDILERVAQRGTLLALDAGEVLMKQGDPSDSFAVVLAGEVRVLVEPEGRPGSPAVEITRLRPADSVGEMGVLLGHLRTATVRSTAKSLVLRFSEADFLAMYERVPGFGVAVSRALASRLAAQSRQVPLPLVEDVDVDPELVSLLPAEFITRHRALPIAQEGNVVTVGLVDDASPAVLEVVRHQLAGMDVIPVRINLSLFDRVMGRIGGVSSFQRPIAQAAPASSANAPAPSASPRLDTLLRRMVAEGCSDVHLSGGQRPRWRIDGEMYEIGDAPVLSAHEVHDLLASAMDERARAAFAADNDVDFAYGLPDVARFRVNMFRDKGGIGAVLRQIPAKILTFEQLALPSVIQRMCEQPKGLILVTGPTGSGKSTTLAAMIDFINKTRRSHIITLEDPIEFVHQSQACLINQREVGAHTTSFHRALKAALREDPDIVLVGELRDLETISLALETANTGHLVFGTLHTSTAISTVDRIIDVFPPDQQAQVRAVLADTLKGVVAQALCRRIGGGRVAALETLVVSYAIANLIREGKTHLMASAMTTSRALGNVLLNEHLAALVNEGRVEFAEALGKAQDKADLARRCGKQAPGAAPGA